MKKLIGILAFLILFFYILATTLSMGGCATIPSPADDCIPGDILLKENQGWIKLDKDCNGNVNVEVHPIDVYVCGDDGSLKFLNLMSVFDGCQYMLVGKKYNLIKAFEDTDSMGDFIAEEFNKTNKSQ